MEIEILKVSFFFLLQEDQMEHGENLVVSKKDMSHRKKFQCKYLASTDCISNLNYLLIPQVWE